MEAKLGIIEKSVKRHERCRKRRIVNKFFFKDYIQKKNKRQLELFYW